ncbi:MAG TPA: sulfite exporter TauE/SafE family protein [Cyclobacteriaceae bacterium]|nr:sulfite exporter TauE/SafE family protein [Cyclobacteriaceae bacterium]
MLTTAFILGLAGSLHCVGMCSPLAYAVTGRRGDIITSKVIYNIGRILMYCILGAGVSALGATLPTIFQYAVSILLGVSLVVIGITRSNFRTPVLVPLMRLSAFLKSRFAYFLRDKKYSSVFMLGVLNGLLPCGLTFLALTTCITLATPAGGFVFMAAFGAGTLPAMLGLVSIIPALTKRFNLNVPRLMVIMQLAAGCLLIVRVLLVEPGVVPTTAGVDQISICP